MKVKRPTKPIRATIKPKVTRVTKVTKETPLRARARERRQNVVGEKALDSSWYAAFFEALSRTGNVRAACTAAGVSRQAAYERKSQFPHFEKLWVEAHAVGSHRNWHERQAARAATLSRHPRQDMSSKRWHASFLEALTDRFSMHDACEAAKVSFDLVQKHITKFPELARRGGKIMALHLLIQKHDPTHHVDAVAVPDQQESPEPENEACTDVEVPP